MSHPLVLALFESHDRAAAGARAVRAQGVGRDDLSIVARSHEEQGQLSRELGGTPGAEIEDSRVAARLGELGGQILAAIALVMPGIGPIVAAGPLSAELGEAAGHAAGGLEPVLERCGIPEARARVLSEQVEQGAVLLGVHTVQNRITDIIAALEQSGAREIEIAKWEGTG